MIDSKKEDPQKANIETLARYLLEKKHATDQLDFKRQVERMDGSANFILKIFSTNAKLIRVYLVSPTTKSIQRDEQPFNINIIGHFRKHKTEPPENYYFVRIHLDKDTRPIAMKIFPMPMEFSEL